MEVYWLIIAAVLLLVGQSIVVRVRKLKGLHYQRTFSTRTCFEGDQIEMVETIRNERLSPLPWIRLESILSANLEFETQDNLAIQAGDLFQNHKSLFSLMPYTEITRKHKVTCLKRGRYLFETVTLSYGDVIGLYTNTETRELNEELIVLPRPMSMDEMPIASESLQGKIAVRRWIMDDPFLNRGIRDYQPGDTLRSISWKATARTGKLQVFEPDYTADPRLFVFINVEIHEKMWKQVTDPDRIEKGIRLAATWIDYAIENGWEAGIGCNGFLNGDTTRSPVRTAIDGGPGQLRYLYETLARIEIERSVPIDVLLKEATNRLEQRTDFVLITSFISESMQNWIQDMRGRGHGVTVVPLEEEKKESYERQVSG